MNGFARNLVGVLLSGLTLVAPEITWQPHISNTFHVPENFGLLKLVTSER
jgi:hypothetical protein